MASVFLSEKWRLSPRPGSDADWTQIFLFGYRPAEQKLGCGVPYRL
jgi:hypothetical protein